MASFFGSPRKRPYEEQARVSFLQRVAKDKKPGYFFAPEGVGYLFEATADSLLNAGLEFGVVDALMNRVLDGVVRSSTLSATSVAAFYHAPFMETQRHEYQESTRKGQSAPPPQQFLGMFMYAPEAWRGAKRVHLIKEFAKDVAAVRDLMEVCGFVMPDESARPANTKRIRNPSRYACINPAVLKALNAVTPPDRGLGVRYTDSRIAGGISVNIPATPIKLHAEVERTVHYRGADLPVEEYRALFPEESSEKELEPVGYEQTTVFLEYLQEKISLYSAKDLWAKTHPGSLENAFRGGPPNKGIHLYHEARLDEQYLLTLALKILKAAPPMSGVTIDYTDYVRTIRNYLASGNTNIALQCFLYEIFPEVDWQEYPEFETAFHIVVYATLYRGAIQRMEDHIAEGIATRVRTACARLGQPVPTVRVERAPYAFPPPGSVLCTPQEWRALSETAPKGNDESIAPLVPSFPVFRTPQNEYLLFPDAIYCTTPGKWFGQWYNPSKPPSSESSSVVNAACVQSVYPEMPTSRHPAVRFIARLLRNLDIDAPITGSLVDEGHPKDKGKVSGVFFLGTPPGSRGSVRVEIAHQGHRAFDTKVTVVRIDEEGHRHEFGVHKVPATESPTGIDAFDKPFGQTQAEVREAIQDDIAEAIRQVAPSSAAPVSRPPPSSGLTVVSHLRTKDDTGMQGSPTP